jgi:hypothetical protein
LNGNYDLFFRITDDVGTRIWDEEHPDVPITDGLFSVLLGGTTPLVLSFDEYYYLYTSINDEWLTTPVLLTAAPYSLNTSALAGIGHEGYLKRNIRQTTAAEEDGQELLRVENTGTGRGMTVVSAGAHGLYGKSTSNQAAVEGEGAGTGTGLRGSSVANHGAVGYSTTGDKAGVYGNNPSGIGVWGNSGGDVGVFGHSSVDNGILGHTVAANEWVPAIYGQNEGMGDGLYGWSQNRHGVFGVTYSTDTSHAGVYATNNGDGPAIHSAGDLYATGAYRGDLGGEFGGAPFPRPAFDSGWIAVEADATVPLGVGQYLPATHFDNDNFVVDLMVRYTYAMNYGVGATGVDGERGVNYGILPDNDMYVRVHSEETGIAEVRLRVWYYR